ncbi:hypothetical protein [Actinokineospora globicatena]|uniref:Capsular polysaccharide biosynthesis protein n=1 Tax=Actinokineospora globicatena TaxID=103729 RepID=A0A9W6QTP1_9PSEU|nr:hypothetical protein [Actinokineospora globicatena]MCP2301898.1 hypothetical protein [Actinokineospora globicatena]GLW76443.1 hypothetical protein Aglo01_09250 [Actinokineospora globicatena]GLW83278.1 hypothetical protein Aglo02_09180 [Actinokineospora globicatena]GLW94738.1 hypothetical protein Aglo03_55540 [Actinokineospora globicatena]
MYFGKFFALLVRRWLVIVPLLLVTLVGAGYAYVSTPLGYQWTGTVVMLAPKDGRIVRPPSQLEQTNSLLAFAPTLSTITIMLIEETAVSAGKLVTQPKDAVEITREGPFMTAKVEGATIARAKELGQQAFDLIRKSLDDKQRSLGAPPSTWVTVSVVTAPAEPEKLPKAKITKVGGILAAGGLLALFCAVAVESVAENRRRRQQPVT